MEAKFQDLWPTKLTKNHDRDVKQKKKFTLNLTNAPVSRTAPILITQVPKTKPHHLVFCSNSIFLDL